MLNMLKKLFSKKPNPISYVGKTEVKPTPAPKIDPLINKATAPAVEKKSAPVSKSADKPTTAAKKAGRPKGQSTKSTAKTNTKKS